MVEELKTEGQEIVDPKVDETTVSISQEKLNSLINEKFKKGAEKSKAELLSSLGVESEDELKSIIEARKQAEEANKTELQKLQEQLESKDKAYSELEQRLNAKTVDTEVQDIIMQNGIDPKMAKYVKIDYLEAKKGEDFELDKFVESLKESQPGFFAQDVRVPANIDNPASRSTPANQIKMADYALLTAEERKKYKSTDIIR